jgi:hypothetical protein
MAAGAASAQDLTWTTWETADGGNGHEYAVLMDEARWLDQAAAAEEAGGYLATILSAEEQDFVYGLIQDAEAQSRSTEDFYSIGLRQMEDGEEPAGGWYWLTGEPLDADAYMNWGYREPNNYAGTEDFGAVHRGHNSWNDVRNRKQFRAVVEREEAPPQDGSAPTVILNEPDPSVLPWSDQPVPVAVSGSVYDDLSGVASATLTLDDEYDELDSDYDLTALLGADGSFALTLDLSATVRPGDADGRTYALTLSAEDNAGNVSAPVSRTVTVPGDFTAPSTSLNAPDPATLMWSATPVAVTFTGSATDAQSGLADVTLAIDDEYGELSGQHDLTGLLGADGSFGTTIDLAATVQAGDADGRVYEVTLTAADNAGNAAEPVIRTVTVEPDTTPPATAIDADPSSLDWSNQPVAVGLSGSVTDDESGVASANVAVVDEYGEAGSAHDVVPLLQADDSFALSVDLPATVQAGDADGRTYQITLSATDNAGNEAAVVSTTVTVDPDLAAPAVTLDAPDPAELEGGQGDAAVAVSGCVTDDLSGVATAVLAVADEYSEADAEQDLAGLRDADGCFVLTLNLPTAVQDGDDARVFALTLTATDNAGNEAASAEQTVTVSAPAGGDTTPPRVKLYPPHPSELRGRPIFRPQRVRIRGQVTDDDSGVASAKLAVDDEYNWCDQEKDVTRQIRRNGKLRTNVYLWAWVNFWDWDGRDYEVSLSATDKAGNAAVSNAVRVRSPHPWERFWRRWR